MVMNGLMMDDPLLISGVIDYAATNHASTEVVAREVDGEVRRRTYAQIDLRARRLASGLQKRGAMAGTRMASLVWNTLRHFELFYAVPGSGAVLHTVNPRLHEDQLTAFQPRRYRAS